MRTLFVVLLWFFLMSAAMAAPAELPRSIPPSDGQLLVDVGVQIIDINFIRTADQTYSILGRLFLTWRDPRLGTSSGDAARIVRREDLWTPPIGFANAQDFQSTMPAWCTIAPDGRVRLEAPFKATFNSPFDLRLFPFDRDSLRMVVHISDAYVDGLDIRVDGSHTSINRDLLFDAEWDVREVHGSNYLATSASDRADQLKFELKVVRRSSFYLWSFFLPMTLLVLTTWSLFWTVSPNLQVTMNGLVAITAYRFAVGSTLPRMSSLSLADAYFLYCLLFIVLTHMAATRIIHLGDLKDTDGQKRFRARCIKVVPLLFATGLTAVVVVYVLSLFG